MTPLRVGWGFDAHPLGGDPPIVLGGVVVDRRRGVQAHSDGDVAAHAVCDAVLGAAGLGDLGEHFPSSDPAWSGAGSIGMLSRCVEMATESGVVPAYADVTVIAEDVRVAPHRHAIRANLATALGLPVEAVSVKATSTDGMGMIGRGEGIAAAAVVTVEAASAPGSPSR